MSNSPICPKCGVQLPPDAPEGLCPACLVQAGFESRTARQADPYAPTTPGQNRTGFQPPDISKLSGLFPQLEILELLGHGGMGAVYKARQTSLDRLVALKIIRPEVTHDSTFAVRFNREAKTLARLSHQHIVTVHDFGEVLFSEMPEDEKRPLYYFVMEYVDGANLRELIRLGQLTPEQALAIVPQICEALQFAHDERIVHRDIKPENILLDKHGRVKIADFGLAKLATTLPEEYTLTQAHQVMGTPRYMAPEQMEGSHTVDHRADIYSLGVVFYEMLTGQVPAGHFDPPSKKVQVDVRLDEVVLRAMAHEPERRYQQASEVKTQVETICGLSPEATQRIFGTEFRSQATLFGLPLVHVAMGLDPQTGRARVAKGIIAIGDKAVGVIAMGGIAVGVLSFGGFSLGLFALGGAAVGLVAALGGLAIGGLPFGGLAIGIIAMGGGAIGLYAGGGWAAGLHVLSSSVQDPEAVRLFERLPWARNWPQWLAALGVGLPVLVASILGYTWSLFKRQQRLENPQISNASRENSKGSSACETAEGT